MKHCTIRIKATGAIIPVKSYGNGWIDSKGNFYHRTAAELVNPPSRLVVRAVFLVLCGRFGFY
jgi:hypothetical protein